MAKYDVHQLPFGEYVVDCQADVLEGLFRTRFVVPLMPADKVPRQIARLHPFFEISGTRMLMATHLAAAVPAADLGEPIMSLAEYEYAIGGALDLLITGI
jgi:toxin CcdB